MSRQRAGWGLSKFLMKFNEANIPRSKTAGINKYDPQTAVRNGEALRRKLQLERLEAKRKKIVAEVGGANEA